MNRDQKIGLIDAAMVNGRRLRLLVVGTWNRPDHFRTGQPIAIAEEYGTRPRLKLVFQSSSGRVDIIGLTMIKRIEEI